MLLLRLTLVARSGRGVLALLLAADVVCLLAHAHCCQHEEAATDGAQHAEGDKCRTGWPLHRVVDAAVGRNCLATIVAAVLTLKAHDSALS